MSYSFWVFLIYPCILCQEYCIVITYVYDCTTPSKGGMVVENLNRSLNSKHKSSYLLMRATLKIAQDVTGVSVHAPIQSNITCVQMVRRSIYKTTVICGLLYPPQACTPPPPIFTYICSATSANCVRVQSDAPNRFVSEKGTF